MQINRLFEMVYLLLKRKKITAKELAQHFEVSVRTIYRDVDILSAANIPIYTSRGKNGGIALLDGFVLDKSTLTHEEQDQILMALQSSVAADFTESQAVLNKFSSLFQKEETWIEVDFSRWGYAETDQNKFYIIKKAITQRYLLTFDYYGTNGQKSKRTIKPIKLVYKSKAWYLQGFCIDKNDYRIFKINRMFQLQLLEEQFENIPAVPLEKETRENKEQLLCVTIRFAPQAAYRLFDEFDEKDISRQADGSFLVTARFTDNQWLYGYLFSFGNLAEVLSPQSVRDKILDLIQQTATLYQKELK